MKEKEVTLSPDEVEGLQKDIQTNLLDIDRYVPILGPFLEFQHIDMKKIAHMMITHQVAMKKVDVVRSADLRWRPITPSMSHIYNAEHHLPQWCLHDLPLVVVPHPDYETCGPFAREQIRLLSTMAVQCGKVERVTEIDDLSNKIGLMKCQDEIVRRISVRYLHDRFFDPDAPQHNFVLELEGGYLLEGSFEQQPFMREVEDSIKEVYDEENVVLLCHHSDVNKQRGTFGDGPLLMEFGGIKFLRHAKKYIEEKYPNIKVRRRSNCIIVFIDENHLEPIILDENLTSHSGKQLNIYHPDPEMNFLKYPPMAVEVWLDLSHNSKLDVKLNFEPFRKRFVQNEVGWGLRSFLRDGKDFRVEFMKQIHRDMPWCWLGQITCNNENLKDKSEGILNSRCHFPIPK